MIDPHSETLVSVSEAARLTPGTPHPATIHRWTTRGISGHKLETIKIGGRRMTSAEALERFFRATTAEGEQQPQLSEKRVAKLRAAQRELDAAGI